MNKALAIILLGACVALGGCKIRITVPEGGRVITQSGAETCQAGTVCEVRVSDLFFDETFVADPAEGFSFSNWRRRERGFCGGNSTPCRLFTSGFAGNAVLLAFLQSDDTFFLEPVFTPTGGAGGGDFGSGSLSGCFNRTLFTEDTSVESRYRITEGGVTEIFENDLYVEDMTIFAGNPATRIELEVELDTEEPGDQKVINNNYVGVNLSARELRLFGSDSLIAGPPQITTMTTFTPFVLTRWNLARGASYSQEYTQRTESDGPSLPGIDSIWEITTTYLGRETIEVPAGRLASCRIEEDAVETNSFGQQIRTISTQWYGVGNGLLLREESSKGSTELLSARINGTPI